MQSFPVLVSCKPLKDEYSKFKKININSENFSLGRSLQNSVVIPSLIISRKHCKIRKENTSWLIEDYSSCSVEVNGVKVGKGKTFKLCHNDIIKLDLEQEFVFKFIQKDDCPISQKKIKLDMQLEDINLINDAKTRFEESHNYEIKHIEDKIQKQKQLKETNKLLKDQIHQQMNRKVEQLEIDFASQIDNLIGENKDIAQQKSLLIQRRDAQIAVLKKEMEKRIEELMVQIREHNKIESELVIENNLLKERFLKEREDFLMELNRESTSKQELLDKLQDKIREQEEIRLKEKADLEKIMQYEAEQLRLAKEKEINDLAQQKNQRELELTEELNKIKETLERQIELTEKQTSEAKEQLANQVQEMKKLSDEDKAKMDQLVKEREEIQKRLLTAEEEAKKSVDELKLRVQAREVELATLAADRIQKQSEQSGEVISSLQEQLEKVKGQLKNVQTEKEKLLENFALPDKLVAGPSKQETLVEVGQIMESELQCSICAELFIFATTLNCSHTFCKHCITLWKKKKKDCPICRAPIASECRSIVLDSFIDKMVQNLTEDMKQKREDMRKSREVDDKPQRRPSPAKRRRRSTSESEYNYDFESEETDEENWSDYDYVDISDPWYHFTSSDSDGGSDGDADSTHAETSNGATRHYNRRFRERVPGVPGSYYGGYGVCFRCGARGHWAPGCPRP
ncbi:unnamed protein product [Leptosia nina]|uniref:E3 ubiquitin-protein ligase CHFR n=1 Tax=Leptosia nina TaxID=320188 RepID=A0AAV1IWM8_9NEOP